jgi:hypothetical protein
MVRTKNAAPLERDPNVLTMRRARILADGARSFRKWARHEFGSRSRGELSPKLGNIVHGPAA